MKHRCTNPNAGNWSRYGGRGITVCDRWMHSFESFMKDMGPRPELSGVRVRYSIDRIDNDGNYEPKNCRWATPKQQNNNTSFNRYVTINGVTRPLKEWLGLYGITARNFYHRCAAGHDEITAIVGTFSPGRPPKT